MEPFVPRVTLTFPALASTHEMLFLIDSADKRTILSRVLVRRDLPARRAHADGRSGVARGPCGSAGALGMEATCPPKTSRSSS